jgi:hypothetical protein
MNSATATNHLDIITIFLKGIQIPVVHTNLSDTCFLPGLKIFKNQILLDSKRLSYFGDLLHEAGHIAVTAPSLRVLIGTDKMQAEWPSQGDEIAAMLWSYAALKHLDLPPETVFHDGGYKKDSKWLIKEYENGRYHGLPLLEWMGLCLSAEKAVIHKKPPFPAMLKWLR